MVLKSTDSSAGAGAGAGAGVGDVIDFGGDEGHALIV